MKRASETRLAEWGRRDLDFDASRPAFRALCEQADRHAVARVAPRRGFILGCALFSAQLLLSSRGKAGL